MCVCVLVHVCISSAVVTTKNPIVQVTVHDETSIHHMRMYVQTGLVLKHTKQREPHNVSLGRQQGLSFRLSDAKRPATAVRS